MECAYAHSNLPLSFYHGVGGLWKDLLRTKTMNMTIKKILLAILSTFVVLGLVLPSSALARERQDSRDTGRTVPSAEETQEEEEDEDQGGSSSTGGGSTIHVTNSIVVSTESGGNEENGEDGVTTGNEDATASVETIVNGEVVQEIIVNGEEIEDDRASLRDSRRHRFTDDSGDVVVETEIEIEQENDTGNQNNDGADGEDGQDGADGTDGTSPDEETPEPEEEEEVVEDNDRRDRGDRSGRGGIAMVWDRVSNFFNNVFGTFFA